jgi:hypothetical protein
MALSNLDQMGLWNRMSSLANWARHGIKYFEMGKAGCEDIPISEFIAEGIRFCKVLIKGSEARIATKITVNQLGYFELVEPLANSKEINFQEVMDDSKKVLRTLKSMLEENGSGVEIKTLDFAKSFLISVGQIYQMKAWSINSFLAEGACF